MDTPCILLHTDNIGFNFRRVKVKEKRHNAHPGGWAVYIESTVGFQPV